MCCKCCQSCLETIYWHLIEKHFCWDESIALYEDPDIVKEYTKNNNNNNNGNMFDNLAFYDSVAKIAGRAIVTIEPLDNYKRTREDERDTNVVTKQPTLTNAPTVTDANRRECDDEINATMNVTKSNTNCNNDGVECHRKRELNQTKEETGEEEEGRDGGGGLVIRGNGSERRRRWRRIGMEMRRTDEEQVDGKMEKGCDGRRIETEVESKAKVNDLVRSDAKCGSRCDETNAIERVSESKEMETEVGGDEGVGKNAELTRKSYESNLKKDGLSQGDDHRLTQECHDSSKDGRALIRGENPLRKVGCGLNEEQGADASYQKRQVLGEKSVVQRRNVDDDPNGPNVNVKRKISSKLLATINELESCFNSDESNNNNNHRHHDNVDTKQKKMLRKKSPSLNDLRPNEIDSCTSTNVKLRKKSLAERRMSKSLSLNFGDMYQQYRYRSELPIIRQSSMPKFYLETPILDDFQSSSSATPPTINIDSSILRVPSSTLTSPIRPNSLRFEYDLKSIVQMEMERVQGPAAPTANVQRHNSRLAHFREKLRPLKVVKRTASNPNLHQRGTN